MFPAGYFPQAYFPAGYFGAPAAEPDEPPIVLPPYPTGSGGIGAGLAFFDPDDDGDEFFLMFTP